MNNIVIDQPDVIVESIETAIQEICYDIKNSRDRNGTEMAERAKAVYTLTRSLDQRFNQLGLFSTDFSENN